MEIKLSKLRAPSRLRKLKREHMKEVCDQLRQRILDVVSEKGGHLASNLGSVEITVALHYIFDTPKDKIVWDVGHQAYGHKILTGRDEIELSDKANNSGVDHFISKCVDPE